MNNNNTQIFSVLNKCTTEELKMFRAFIDSKLAFDAAPVNWTGAYLSNILVPHNEPVDIIATAKPIVAKPKQPTDWFITPVSGERYGKVCSKSNAECGCRYYPQDDSMPFASYNRLAIDRFSLYIYGLDRLAEIEDNRKRIIDIIGHGNSKSIRVVPNTRFAFVLFRNHADAVAAQKLFSRQDENGLLANFALKTDVRKQEK